MFCIVIDKIWSLIKKEIVLLLVIFLYLSFVISKIYSFPVYIDEAATFNECVSKGFLATITYYKEPNNHVFFSLILLLFKILPIDPLIAMRLPNVIIGIFSILLMNKILRLKFGKLAANFGVVFFSFSYYFLFYSIFARGYMVLMFLTIASYFVLEMISLGKSITIFKYKINSFFLFSILTLIGFSTIPIYLYISFSFFLVYLIRFNFNIKSLYPLFKSYLVSALLILVFYFPILFTSGLNSIISNRWTEPVSRNEVVEYIYNNWFHFYDKLFGVSSGIIIMILFCLLIVFYFLFKIERKFIVELLIFMLLPFLMILIHSVLPGSRTWCYLIVPLAIILTYIFSKILFFISAKIQYLLLLISIISTLVIEIHVFESTHPGYGLKNDLISNDISNYLWKFENRFVYFCGGEQSYEYVIDVFEHKRIGKSIRNLYFHFSDTISVKSTFIFVGNQIKQKDKLLFKDRFGEMYVYKK